MCALTRLVTKKQYFEASLDAVILSFDFVTPAKESAAVVSVK